MRWLLRWIIGAVALYLTVLVVQALGVQGLALRTGGSGFVSALVAILALTLANSVLRPILALLTLPLNCLTLGLFSFVLNALMFWLVGSLDLGFQVRGFWPALIGSLVLSVISGILNAFVVEPNEEKNKR